MKQKFLILIAVSAMVFAGCGSGRDNSEDADSLMQDSGVIDTVNMGANPADTSVMRIDTVGRDTGLVVH